jgi:tRNA pseudouridine55 synthase
MARRGGANRLHGYLVIDKPAFWTSHDVVGRLRKLTGERKVGHAGTLDPGATGVLPVAIGEATRSLEYLAESSKTYVAEVTLGVTTDSHDADGTVVATRSVPDLELHRITEVVDRFLGPHLQLPPMHSAIKVNGRRLYELARRGEEIARDPRPVVFHELELLSWTSPVLRLRVDCSKGTYIRALARDLGEQLGCGGYLSNLVRTRTGPFELDDAWTLAELESLDLIDDWERIAVHPDAGAQLLDAIVIEPEAALSWKQGKALPGCADPEALVRVYDDTGNWLGIGRGTRDRDWQPEKVIIEAA